jgi:uncharacterized protein with HEPN domain
MKGQLTDRIRIYHILDAIAETENYLTNSSFEDFISNSEKRFATIKQIEIVGEACNHLTNELKQQHSEIEWLQINGFRNISVHEYFGINLRIVWDIANNDLPVLKLKFIEVLKKL